MDVTYFCNSMITNTVLLPFHISTSYDQKRTIDFERQLEEAKKQLRGGQRFIICTLHHT
jgi:hypothetical protein